jgi:predicted nucleic acid-binding Zn ribbon protein
MEPLAPTLRSVAADWLKKTEPASVPLVLWPLICGEAIAARTRAVSFTDGTLVIAVPDRHWITQLQEFVARYLAALNEVSPVKVRSIEFQVNAR